MTSHGDAPAPRRRRVGIHTFIGEAPLPLDVDALAERCAMCGGVYLDARHKTEIAEMDAAARERGWTGRGHLGAFRRGWATQRLGGDRAQCPYPIDTGGGETTDKVRAVFQRAWLEGFAAARPAAPVAVLGDAAVDALSAIISVWDLIVGDEATPHVRAAVIVGDALVIAVDAMAWGHHLAFLEPQILRAIERFAKVSGIARLRFRHGPSRGAKP